MSLPLLPALSGAVAQVPDVPPAASLLLILAMGIAMSVIALVGVVAIVLPKRILDRALLPMVGFAAGSLIGGALFHLLPEAIGRGTSPLTASVWMAAGFTTFFVLEQFLHWHRSHTRTVAAARPEAILILIGDALHNLLGGLAVGAAFLIDPRVGWSAWLAAAAHEVPQELGDFAILVHGGVRKRRALALNFLCALTFPLGAIGAWSLSGRIDVLFLLPFAAGNFLYIGASDLIPEIKHSGRMGRSLVHLVCFLSGLALLRVLAGAVG